MNQLQILQTTSSIEVVASSIIDKLYELAQNPSLDANSTIQGNLQCTHAYEDAVTYLLNKFPNLQINVTGGAYTRFTDSVVASICATNWGDGTGITALQVATVTDIGTSFQSANITYFNELRLFTSLKNSNFCGIINIVNLVEISIPDNFTYFNNGSPQGIFYNALKLQKVVLPKYITNVGYALFGNCSLLELSELPETSLFTSMIATFKGCSKITLTTVPSSVQDLSTTFDGCSSITTFTIPSTVRELNATFKNCTSLNSISFNEGNNDLHLNVSVGGWDDGVFAYTQITKLHFPARLVSIGNATFAHANLVYIVFDSTTPPTIGSISINNTCIFYVPDASLSAYQSDSGWSTYSSRIFSLTQFAIDFPNG